MNLDQFLEALRNTPRDWRIASTIFTDRITAIRRSKDKSNFECECPISSLKSMPAYRFNHVAEELGMEINLRDRIIRSADHDSRYFKDSIHKEQELDLRAQLLEACGLGLENL